MPTTINNIDFEGNGLNTDPQDSQQNVNNNEPVQLNGGDPNDPTDVTNPNQNDNQNDNNQNDNQNDNNNNGDGNDNPDVSSSTGGLNEGDTLDIDGVVYTVDAEGNIVDSEGNIFKEAKDVDAWLAEQTVQDNNDDNGEFDINSIINAVGINVTDDAGNPVEFTNDAAGVKAYIDNVMELRSTEIADATINKLFDDAPIVKEFIDYLAINGSARGFGEIRDLSGVTLDKENTEQLETVIREAAKEFGNTSLSDSYIKYLKDSGGLYDEANRQLQAMIARDNELRTQREEQAKAAREAENARVKEYWDGVQSVINSRNIAGYKIPETFVLERDGRKVSLTPNDFMHYLTYRDKETGLSGYQQDLEAMSAEDIMQNELLDAWLHFTGKTYKDLIGMAVKEEKVRQLKIQSKQNPTQRTIKINRNKPSKVDINQIVLS